MCRLFRNLVGIGNCQALPEVRENPPIPWEQASAMQIWLGMRRESRLRLIPSPAYMSINSQNKSVCVSSAERDVYPNCCARPRASLRGARKFLVMGMIAAACYGKFVGGCAFLT